MDDKQLHKKLPIGENEKVLNVIKHHWFAYTAIYLGAGFICLCVLLVIFFATLSQSSMNLSDGAVGIIISVGIIFIFVTIVASLLPVWVRKQEMLVLTEEALLQVEKPSVFANRISQLNLAHISDVTVTQSTVGSILGYGNLNIETPGEQNNYDFAMVAKPQLAAKAIIEAHENYAAGLEGGHIESTFSKPREVVDPQINETPKSE